MRTNYPFKNILEQIPTRYTGLSSSQLQDRQSVYQFKDGNCSEGLLDKFCQKIREITSQNPGNWVICFVPASSQSRTAARFNGFSARLNYKLGTTAPACPGAISVTQDCLAGHLNGKNDDPTRYFSFDSSFFRGKKVILIDDVITRGRTFNDTAAKLKSYGATAVTGLFVAKTIHPDLPIGAKQSYHDWEYDDYMNDLVEQDMLADELAAEQYEQEMYDEMMADDYSEEYYEEAEVFDDYDYCEDY